MIFCDNNNECNCDYTNNLDYWDYNSYYNGIGYQLKCYNTNKINSIQFGIKNINELNTKRSICLDNDKSSSDDDGNDDPKYSRKSIQLRKNVLCETCKNTKEIRIKKGNNKYQCSCDDIDIRLKDVSYYNDTTCLTYYVDTQHYRCKYNLKNIIIGVTEFCPTYAPTNSPTTRPTLKPTKRYVVLKTVFYMLTESLEYITGKQTIYI